MSRTTDTELERRIDANRKDYKDRTGEEFNHFFCPILQRDEHAEMCCGHIINDAFGICNAWIPQRKDVDNFYGAVAEADFVTVIEKGDKNLISLLSDPKLRHKHKPDILVDGEALPFYFPEPNAKPVDGQTTFDIVADGERKICRVAVKASAETMFDAEQRDLRLHFERDYQAPVIAALLKAAHLTMFRMQGYHYALSPGGKYVAHILGSFFDKHRTARNVSKTERDDYFIKHVGMVAPMEAYDEEVVRGTVEDNKVLVYFTGSGLPFVKGVFIKAGDSMFSVFLPADAVTLNTYLSFLKSPPESVAAKVATWVPADQSSDGEARWELPPGEPMRIPMRPRDTVA